MVPMIQIQFLHKGGKKSVSLHWTEFVPILRQKSHLHCPQGLPFIELAVVQRAQRR